MNVNEFWPLVDARADAINFDEKFKELTAELEDLLGDAANLGDDDHTRIDEIEAELSKLERLKNAADRIAGSKRSTRRVAPAPAADPIQPRNARAIIPAQPKNPFDERTHGFRNMGEFALNVHGAYTGDASSIERLTNAATTFATEATGGEGGYLVPADFRAEMWKKVNESDSLMARCADFRTSRNALTFPKDETTPWDNTTGIITYWEGEADAVTASKAKFEVTTARLNKLMALVNVTDELLEDAAGLESYLRMWAPVKMRSRINTAIVSGNGVGKPLGILNASSLVTVAKETSQDAASIIMPNINKMWNRMYAPCRANAVWIINQECEPQLEGMQFIPANEFGSSASASVVMPVYMPSGGLSERPYATLKGRPVIPVQPCSALGTLGDIMLVDFAQYMILTKAAQEPQIDVSMHLYFDQALQSFRFMFRVTGQPLWNSVVTPENGSNTYSWAVGLATRA